jgi:hypothetical protein
MEQQGRHKNLPSTSPSFQSLYSTVEPQLICLASNSRQVRPADIPQHNGTNQCSYLKHRYELFSTGSTTAATPSLHDPSTWACLHICNNKPRLIPQSHTLQSIPKPAIESSHREPFRQHNPARTQHTKKSPLSYIPHAPFETLMTRNKHTAPKLKKKRFPQVFLNGGKSIMLRQNIHHKKQIYLLCTINTQLLSVKKLMVSAPFQASPYKKTFVQR